MVKHSKNEIKEKPIFRPDGPLSNVLEDTNIQICSRPVVTSFHVDIFWKALKASAECLQVIVRS